MEVRGDTDVPSSVTLRVLNSSVSLRIAGVQQFSSGKANDWSNREHVVLDLFSNFKMG